MIAARWRIAIAAAAWFAVGPTAQGEALAHDLRPGVLSLAEAEPGVYDLRLVAPVDNRGDAVAVDVVLPQGCARQGDRVRCADRLGGTLAVRGMRGPSMRTIVTLRHRDGTRAEWILSADAPEAVLRRAPPPTWSAWVGIGVDHILGGLDHLGFVLGLLLVLGLGLQPVLDRRLLGTITAFTVAHSVTLGLAATGAVHVAAAVVEACIAASVVLVAHEATHRRPTLTRRWPWLAAAGFGLIHGLGFASALGDLGLSRESIATSLVFFNLGVELGQLAVVAALVVLTRLAVARVAFAPRLHRGACYLLGATAAWWLIERITVVAAGAS